MTPSSKSSAAPKTTGREPANSDRAPVGLSLLSEGHFRDILLALPVALYATDAEGRIVFFNDAAASYWGRRPQIGEDLWCGSWRLFWPDGRPMDHEECPMARTLQTGVPVRGAEAVAERPDGTRVTFIPHPTLLFNDDGTIAGAVNLLVDITHRKSSEEAAHRLAAIVDSAGDAIVGKTLDGIITSWNKGAERIFGYSEAEAIGQPITMLIPADRHGEEADILRRIRAGERVEHFETIRRHKDGTELFISLTISPVRDSHGKILGASKIARDITERVRNEKAQRRQARRLEILNQIAKLLSRDLDLERIVQAVIDVATELSGAKFGCLFYNAGGGETEIGYALSGIEREEFEKSGLLRNIAALDPVFRGAGAVRAGDVRDGTQSMSLHGDRFQDQPALASFLAVPVVSRSGEVIGGLFFGHDDPGVFTQESEDIVVGIAAHAAIAIDNARLHRSAQEEIDRRKRAEEIKELLLNEIKHRVKNTLGTVQAIASQTFRDAPHGERMAFTARLQALADAHDLLTQKDWGLVAISDVIRRSLAAFQENRKERFAIDGPEAALTANKALLLAMALHELATNAVKYGALSNGSGRIGVSWDVEEHDGRRRMRLAWRETGGPKVEPPSRKGFGSKLLERAFAGEQGTARFDFAPEGVVCALEMAI